jgi:hypothetical protein
MITLTDIKKHIHNCKKRNMRYDWLKFVENKDLTPEVEALFSAPIPGWWDWVNGNKKLKELEETTK